MRNVLSLLLVASSLSFAQADDDVAWYKVVSKDGGLAAMLPGKVAPKKMENGEQFILEADGGNSAYLLQWNKVEIQIDIKDEQSVKKLMDNVQGVLLKSLEGGKLVLSEDFELDDFPARAIDVAVPSLGIYRVDVICDGHKLYQVTVLGKQEFVDGDDASAFMGSFRLLAK